MRAYGIERLDRIKCSVKGCTCGDMSSKHPREKGRANSYNKNKRLKKKARQEAKQMLK